MDPQSTNQNQQPLAHSETQHKQADVHEKEKVEQTQLQTAVNQVQEIQPNVEEPIKENKEEIVNQILEQKQEKKEQKRILKQWESEHGQQTTQNDKAAEKIQQKLQETQAQKKEDDKLQKVEQKIEEKVQQKVQQKKQQIPQRTISKQLEIKLDDIGVLDAADRPISITLNKDTMPIEKKNQIVFKEPDVKIEIKQTMQKGFALNKQVFFRITGSDNHGPIDIYRRIEQFQSLKKILLERWPGCFVPSLSQKSDARNEELRGLHRRKNLEDFIKKISYSEEIYYKEEVQLFLRCAGVDMEQMFSQMPVLRVRDVMERLRTCFGEAVEQPNSPDNLSKITKFSTSLKKIAHNLQNLAKRVLKLAQSYQAYQEAMPKFSNFLAHYEQSCLSQYTSNPNLSIALRDTEQKLNKLKIISNRSNIFYDLYFLLDCQNRDAEALSDVILAMQMFNIKRDDLELQSKQTRQQIDQISLGHKNIKVMTSRKTKEQVQQELQQKQKQLIAQKHLILELSGMSQIVLASITIPLFKKMKINNYFRIIKKWVDTIGEVNIDVYEVWKFLGEESRGMIKKSTIVQ